MKTYKWAAAFLGAGLLCQSVMSQNSPPPPGGGDGAPPQRGQRGPGGPGAGGPGGPGGFGGMMGRQRLSPEKAKAAWQVEATGVSHGLSLDEQKTTQVVAAYVQARQSHQEAMEKMAKEMMDNPPPPPPAGGAPDDGGAGGPGGGPGGRGGMFAEAQKKIAEIGKSSRDALQAELAKMLSADQTAKAIEVLGNFNPNWDVMVDTITGFKLDAAKNSSALAAVQTFVVAQGKNRNSDDPQANRTAMQEARKQLSDSLKTVLTEEQVQQFEKATMGGRRQGGRGNGGPNGPGGQRGGGDGGGDLN